MQSNLLLQRYTQENGATLGLLYDNGKFLTYILENTEKQAEIGAYQLTIRKEDTPLTLTYRRKYGKWFKYFIEVTGVMDGEREREYIYFHSANLPQELNGCLAPGTRPNIPEIAEEKELRITNSAKEMERIYSIIYPQLEDGKEILITIRNIWV